MGATESPDIPFVGSVLHPTDFSPESDQAFAHALAIALRRQAELTILHAGSRDLHDGEWTQFPPVRATLERWGHLQPGSPRSAVFKELAVRVKKVKLRGGDPLKAILAYLRDHTTDLIVLATEGREGLPRWLRPSVAERLARRSRTLTLFVPNQGRGIVSLADGSSSLRRMLIPVDHRPSPQAALVYAGRAAARLGEPPVEAIVLHVGERDMPALELPEAEGCTWKRVLRSGEPIDEILRAVESEQVDLIVMATAGHDGILDALRGSVTEQVLRRAGCPLLAVPAA